MAVEAKVWILYIVLHTLFLMAPLLVFINLLFTQNELASWSPMLLFGYTSQTPFGSHAHELIAQLISLKTNHLANEKLLLAGFYY